MQTSSSISRRIPILAGALAIGLLLFIGSQAQAQGLSLASAQPDLQVSVRFKPTKLTSTAAQEVRFYIDVKNVGSAKFTPAAGNKVVVCTVNGNGVEFPKKTFYLGQIAVGKTVTYTYTHDDLWPVEHCFAKYVRAKATANDVNKRNNIGQVTGQSVSDAIAALLNKNKFKFGS